jgi:RHS repeat-associated protein
MHAYDAHGRRKSKTVNGTTTVLVIDADNREVLEYDGTSGTIRHWYAYGLGSNDVLSQMTVATPTRATFVPDIQGSIIGSLDATSGAMTKRGYLPFGGSASVTGSFAYTGQRVDPETNGLYYYRSRHYMPAWGRFMQPDPIGYSGSNLYAYVGNDALNNVDPSGSFCVPCIGAASSVLLGAGIRYATGGNPFDPTAIAIDAALGAVGAGLASKFSTAVQLAEAGAPGSVAYARYIGALGEEAIGATGNRQGIQVGASTLFPDIVGPTGLQEAKNVATISASDASQIASYATFSAEFELGPVQVFTRGGTNIARIQDLISSGAVQQQFLPGISDIGVYSLTQGEAALS